MKGTLRLALGDVHGLSHWKRYREYDFSEFYILGDYFDGFGTTFEGEFRNFKELMEFARGDPRVRLCLGNHDYHYIINDPEERYSRYQKRQAGKIREALESCIDLFQILYVCPGEEGDYLVSHAGLSLTYFNSLRPRGCTKPEDINGLFRRDPDILRFNGLDIFGDDPSQSPIWIRPDSLRWDPFPGYNQIVGHTPTGGEIRQEALEGGRYKLILIDTAEAGLVYQF